jgi:uncharacterized protein (DUF169 family)
MRPLKTDLSIFRKFNFEKSPVGVNYLAKRPEGIEKLDKTMAICEMIKEAQERGTPFYIDKDNEDCAGKFMLGMEGGAGFSGGGEIGVKFEIFQDARANRRIYQNQSSIGRGTINYVAFFPLEKMTYEPDLLFILASVSQAEIIMRAMSYTNGEMWLSKMTGVGACSWLFIYPYLNGKVNYVVTGMGFGMKAKEVYPDGRMLISIPYDWIPVITQSLNEIKWVLPSFTEGREKFLKRDARIKAELMKEAQDS